MAKRRRRSTQERIQDLLDEVTRLKEKERAKQRNTEALKKTKSALRATQKALDVAREDKEADLVKALERAVAILEGVFGDAPVATRTRRTKEQIAETRAEVLRFLEVNAQVSMGDVAEALEQETKEVRPVLFALLEEGLVRKEGERRGTRYTITAKGRKKVA